MICKCLSTVFYVYGFSHKYIMYLHHKMIVMMTVHTVMALMKVPMSHEPVELHYDMEKL